MQKLKFCKVCLFGTAWNTSSCKCKNFFVIYGSFMFLWNWFPFSLISICIFQFAQFEVFWWKSKLLEIVLNYSWHKNQHRSFCKSFFPEMYYITWSNGTHLQQCIAQLWILRAVCLEISVANILTTDKHQCKQTQKKYRHVMSLGLK